jgi:hypothetical protein
LVFSTSDNGTSLSDRLIIKHDGNVGIGTTNPTYKLHVAGSGSSYLPGGIQLDSTNKITFGNPNQFITAVNNTSLTLATAGSASLTVLDNGDVGIGITLATADLHLNADATTTNAFQIEADTVTTGNVIDVVNADALTTGGILDLVSNSSDTGTRNLVNIRNGNSAATGAVPLKVEQDANQTGIELTSDCTTEPGLLVQANSLTTGAAIYGYSDSSATGSLRGVIRGRQASTSAVSSYVGYFQQKSTQSVLGLEKDATTGGGFIDYRGDEGANTTDPVSTHGTAGTIQKWIQVEVNGTKYWMPVYSAPSA